MNMSFYTAAVGAQQQQNRLDVHANNIANVNTNGFKAKIPGFSSLMYDKVRSADSGEISRGTGSYLSAARTNFNPTGLKETDNSFDYAIEGNGFFALYNPGTGEITYSRDGSFTKSEFTTTGDDGAEKTAYYLSDGNGRFILSDEGDLVEVTSDTDKLNIGIFDFVNTDGMLSVGDNMFVPVDKNGQVQLVNGKLIQGYLECSNADLATELTKVIEAQRSFSYALKMIETSDEIETTTNNLR